MTRASRITAGASRRRRISTARTKCRAVPVTSAVTRKSHRGRAHSWSIMKTSATTACWLKRTTKTICRKTVPSAGGQPLATTHSIPVAAFKLQEESCFDILGMQFNPEVYHSEFGKKIIHNYFFNVCGCTGEWTPAHFITDTVEALKQNLQFLWWYA